MISIAIKQFAGVKFYYCVMLVDIFGMLEKTRTQFFFFFFKFGRQLKWSTSMKHMEKYKARKL